MTCNGCRCGGEMEDGEVRMSISSLGENSAAIGVNIPKSLEDRIMRMCARDDTFRSRVIRSALMIGLPVLESFPGLADNLDPGGKDCPLDIADLFSMKRGG